MVFPSTYGDISVRPYPCVNGTLYFALNRSIMAGDNGAEPQPTDCRLEKSYSSHSGRFTRWMMMGGAAVKSVTLKRWMVSHNVRTEYFSTMTVVAPWGIPEFMYRCTPKIKMPRCYYHCCLLNAYPYLKSDTMESQQPSLYWVGDPSERCLQNCWSPLPC